MNKRQIITLTLSFMLSASTLAAGSGSKLPPKKIQATAVEMVISDFGLQSSERSLYE